MKAVKNVVIIIAVLIVLLPVLMYGMFYIAMFRATALNYTDDVTDGNFQYLTRDERSGTLLYRRQGKIAAVIGISYDPNSGVTEFTIPSACGDYPVEGLGGYVGKGGPCPFGIDIEGIRCTEEIGLSDGSFGWYATPHDLEYEYCDLVLNIGPNVREIFADQGGLKAGRKLYVVRVYINCDPDNPEYYSVDGRLYTKHGELVKGFLYWDEDYKK